MDIKKAYKAIRANNPKCAARFAIEHARRALDNSETTDYQLVVKCDSGQSYKIPAHNSRGAVWNPVFKMENSRRAVRWCEDTARAGLRFVAFADEINSFINHTGWFTDDDGYSGETLRGAVWQLPAHNGAARFVGGYIDPCNDGAALIDIDVFEDESARDNYGENPRELDGAKDAARCADSLAEWCAEEQREHNRQWQASRDIENKREEIEAARVRHSHNVRNYGAHGTAKHVDNVLREDSASLRATVSELVREIRALFSELPNGEIVD